MIDALIVGMDVLMQHCGTKKYKKRVFLITDGEKKTNVDQAQMQELINSITSNEIKLNCIAMDFCDELAEDSEEDEDEEDPEANHDDKVDLNKTK